MALHGRHCVIHIMSWFLSSSWLTQKNYLPWHKSINISMNYSITKATCSLLGVSEWLPSRDSNNNSDALLSRHNMNIIFTCTFLCWRNFVVKLRSAVVMQQRDWLHRLASFHLSSKQSSTRGKVKKVKSFRQRAPHPNPRLHLFRTSAITLF